MSLGTVGPYLIRVMRCLWVRGVDNVRPTPRSAAYSHRYPPSPACLYILQFKLRRLNKPIRDHAILKHRQISSCDPGGFCTSLLFPSLQVITLLMQMLPQSSLYAISRSTLSLPSDSDEPPLVSVMHKTGKLAYKEYTAHRRMADLEISIQSLRVAMELAEDDHPEMIDILTNLAITLYMRYHSIGDLSDLEEAISLGQLLVALVPDDSYKKPTLLTNLASSIFTRFDREGRFEDLDEAIALDTRADELATDDHEDKGTALNNLGTSLFTRFEHLGNADDMDKAIQLQSRAVEIMSRGHPQMSASLTNLGNSLEWRYKRFGRLEDLERAIALKTQSLALVPDNHPEKPKYLNNTSSSLQARFNHLDNLEDLEKAIGLASRAIELSPDDHPGMSSWLLSLADSLSARYGRTGDPPDLRMAIANEERAVAFLPDGHPDKPMALNNLGNSLVTRFERSKDLNDLDRAIAVQTKSVDLTPEGNLGRSSRIHNLSRSFRERFAQAGEVADLEDAIKYEMRAVELLPATHPERARFLTCLGLCFEKRLRSLHGQVDGDAERAMEAYLEAIEHAPSPPALRLPACILYTVLLTDYPQLSTILPRLTILEAWELAMNLVPRSVWLGNDLRGRYTSDQLQTTGRVVNGAAAAAIAAGEYSRALEWLETGRAIVWSQVLQLQTPHDNLRRLHPELANSLDNISRALQQTTTPSLNSPLAPVQEPLSWSLHSYSTSSKQPLAVSSHSYALEYDKLVARIRSLEGFENFMRPKTFSQLVGACATGPVVIINMHMRESKSDALVLYQAGDVVHIPLPGFSYARAKAMQKLMWTFLRSEFLLGRARGDLQGGPDDSERGGNIMPKDARQNFMGEILAELWKLVVKPIMDVICTLVSSPV